MTERGHTSRTRVYAKPHVERAKRVDSFAMGIGMGPEGPGYTLQINGGETYHLSLEQVGVLVDTVAQLGKSALLMGDDTHDG